jgi:hypothetical protein
MAKTTQMSERGRMLLQQNLKGKAKLEEKMKRPENG